ncbi:MAG: hypothetical protein J0H15_12395 [Xanthomonadales bacterium]|nr:hypothetical protein [Xanthomonadales bacterium]
MTPIDPDILKPLARKYIWWKSPDEALASPDRIIAQVMDIGDYDDVQRLVHAIGDDALAQVLSNAEPGEFSPRSWVYWHCRLGLAPPDRVPPLPRREFA